MSVAFVSFPLSKVGALSALGLWAGRVRSACSHRFKLGDDHYLRAEQAAHNVAEQRDCDAERSKNRYARFWRAAYLRMADCELRQAAFREWFEKLSIRSVQTHDCVRTRSGLLAYYSRQSCTDPRRR